MSDISSLESELSSDESVEDETGSDKSDIDEDEVLGGSSTGDVEQIEIDSEDPVEDVVVPSDPIGSKISDEANNNTKKSYNIWNGQRLFPPARKHSNPAKAWKFGGFLKDKTGQLIIDKTMCGICGKEQKYCNTPSNLTQHLQLDHSLEYHDNGGGGGSTSKISDFWQPKSKKSKYSKGHPKQQQFREKLVEWVVKNKRPLSIVEDAKLVEAFEIADDKLKVPTRGMITADVKELFKKVKCKPIHSFSDIEYFTCINDAGSLMSMSTM